MCDTGQIIAQLVVPSFTVNYMKVLHRGENPNCQSLFPSMYRYAEGGRGSRCYLRLERTNLSVSSQPEDLVTYKSKTDVVIMLKTVNILIECLLCHFNRVLAIFLLETTKLTLK